MSFELMYSGEFRGHKGGDFKFSNKDLKSAVTAYDPKKYRAPIVLGHPKTVDPAMGWIDSLSWDEVNEKLIANPVQVQPAFAEAVQKGIFKTVSASLYLPDDSNNPTPGTLNLKHVGFLGAASPAIKGLKEAVFNPEEIAVPDFAEGGESVTIENDISRIEFAEEELAHWDVNYHFKAVGRILRNLKNKFIELYSQEEADKLLPEYDLETVIGEVQTITNNNAMFGEEYNKEDTMTEREMKLEKQITSLNTEKAESDKRADFAEKQLAQQADQVNKDKAVSFAEDWTKEGRISIKAKDQVATNLLTVIQAKPEFAEESFDFGKAVAEFAESLAPAGTFKAHSKESFTKGKASTVSTPEFAESDADFAEEVEEYAKEHNIDYVEASEKLLKNKS